jgi:hypothetical protein
MQLQELNSQGYEVILVTSGAVGVGRQRLRYRKLLNSRFLLLINSLIVSFSLLRVIIVCQVNNFSLSPSFFFPAAFLICKNHKLSLMARRVQQLARVA